MIDNNIIYEENYQTIRGNNIQTEKYQITSSGEQYF
jgi:hypothetical protein